MMNISTKFRLSGVWIKTAIYTTTIALIGTITIIALFPGGFHAFCLGANTVIFVLALILSNIAIWFLGVLAIRRAGEIAALTWALFSPVIGLGLLGVFCAPYHNSWYVWVFGALGLTFNFWITWPVSITCAVIVYRLVQDEANPKKIKI